MHRRLKFANLVLWVVAVSTASAQEDSFPRLNPDEAVPAAAWRSPEWSEPGTPAGAEISAASTAARSPMVPSAQPRGGALAGRIVFMNSGHGWIFETNTTTPYWRLQRPNGLNSMNEDYGNLDQLNLFAAYCFNAGATVVSMRPLGQQTNEVVLDNDDAGATFAGTWSSSSSSIYFGSPGDVAYRFASFSASETATATYTPTLPQAGYYPVYTWVRHGSDRGDQLYRIRHTGGESQIRVPHYLVGNGWIYLGEYHFNAGSNAANGAVVISNLRGSTNGSVVIADAVRFGNGMGTVDRGGGPSGYPREEESCRYWIQHNLGQGQSTSLYETTGNDEQDSWSAPPRMSAEMNREQAGTLFDRVHISFHSNAGGGRGTVGLITGASTPNQAALAALCGQTVNDELVALGAPPLEYGWYDRGSDITFAGGYSEISNNNLADEMDATIIEVAYHDNATDAALMRDAKARAAIARAAMHAVVKYVNEFDTNNPVPLIYLPEPPTNPRAIGHTNGAITLTWAPPVTVADSGAPTNYWIYRSTNGYGFGNPIAAGNVTSFTLTNLPVNTDHYFRITAANAGGESFPAEVVGCRTSLNPASPKVLFVNAFDRFDRTTNLRQNLTAQNYQPPGGVGNNERVLPRRVNSFDYVVPHGRAISAYGLPFDSCQNEAVAANLVALTNYPVVIWACGNESTADESFSATEQTRVTAFLAAGGNLFVSGSEIAWDLDRPSGPTAADRDFLRNQLHAAYAADNSGNYNINAAPGSLFAGNPAGVFDDGSRGAYLVGYPDVLTPNGAGATATLTYGGGPAGAAAVAYAGPPGTGKVVYFGFPFETVISEALRLALMTDILNFFGAAPAPLPLQFTRISPLSPTQFKLTLSGEPGAYLLQTSAVLNAWGTLTTLTNASGTFEFTDTVPPGSPARFYRARTP